MMLGVTVCLDRGVLVEMRDGDIYIVKYGAIEELLGQHKLCLL